MCVFVFAYAKIRFSNDDAQMVFNSLISEPFSISALEIDQVLLQQRLEAVRVLRKYIFVFFFSTRVATGALKFRIWE